MQLDEVRSKTLQKDESVVEVDLTGKRMMKCPYCGSVSEITPRQVSPEDLIHMKKVERLYEKMKGIKPVILNYRLLSCVVCGKNVIGKDEYTKKIY